MCAWSGEPRLVATRAWIKLWEQDNKLQGQPGCWHINSFSDLEQVGVSHCGFCYIVLEIKVLQDHLYSLYFYLVFLGGFRSQLFHWYCLKCTSYTKIHLGTLSCPQSYHSGNWSFLESRAVVCELQKSDPNSRDQLFLYYCWFWKYPGANGLSIRSGSRAKTLSVQIS